MIANSQAVQDNDKQLLKKLCRKPLGVITVISQPTTYHRNGDLHGRYLFVVRWIRFTSVVTHR